MNDITQLSGGEEQPLRQLVSDRIANPAPDHDPTFWSRLEDKLSDEATALPSPGPRWPGSWSTMQWLRPGITMVAASIALFAVVGLAWSQLVDSDPTPVIVAAPPTTTPAPQPTAAPKSTVAPLDAPTVVPAESTTPPSTATPGTSVPAAPSLTDDLKIVRPITDRYAGFGDLESKPPQLSIPGAQGFVTSDELATIVWAFMDRYASSINQGQPEMTWDLFSEANRSSQNFEVFASGYSNSSISNVSVESTWITADEQTVGARVGFISRQDAAVGPSGWDCAHWFLEYRFDLVQNGVPAEPSYLLLDAAETVTGEWPKPCVEPPAKTGAVCSFNPETGGQNPWGMRTFYRIFDTSDGATLELDQFGNAVNVGATTGYTIYSGVTAQELIERFRADPALWVNAIGSEAPLFAEFDAVLGCNRG